MENEKTENDNQVPGPVEPAQVFATVMTQMLEDREKERAIKQKEARWKNVRFFAGAAIVILTIGLYVGVGWYVGGMGGRSVDGDYVSLVRINGVISSDSEASAGKINRSLEKAFKDEDAKGVVLLINSPGGAPVQSSLIHDRLLQLRNKYPDRKVIAIGEDLMASGAYFIAAGAPEIYANRSTIAGSIGVIRAGFGFQKLLQQYGIERRVFTAGENKIRADAFQPIQSEDRKKLNTVLDQIHQHFIDAVTTSRGDRLKGNRNKLFSGDVWLGDEAVQLGLIDGLGDLHSIIEKKFDVSEFKDYTPKKGIKGLLKGMAVSVLHSIGIMDSSGDVWMLYDNGQT
ncbi:MAG: S49 family peptidase [Gammaproteobacteria bacterium]|nr:S49 family peptidase [Gammaproteobacteria bacterium]